MALCIRVRGMNRVLNRGAPHDTDVLVLVGSVSDVECGILRHLRSWPHKITMNILKCSLVAGSFSVLEVSGADDMTFTVSFDGVLDEHHPLPLPPPADGPEFDFLEDMLSRGKSKQRKLNGETQAEHNDFALETELEKIMEQEANAFDELQDMLKTSMMEQDLGWLQEEEDAAADELEEQEAAQELAAEDQEVEEAAAAPPAPVPLPSAEDQLAQTLADLGWSDASTSNIFYFNEIETGHRALVIFPLAGLKAVCQKHRDCVCWLSEVAAGNPNAMVSLMRWGGAGASTSREEHQLAGAELKRLFGMRPRRGSLG